MTTGTQRETSLRRDGVPRQRLVTAAGWMTVAFGAVHLGVTFGRHREIWSRAAAEGWWHTFSLARGESPTELRRSETLWVSMGSFGAPMVALGALLVHGARRGRPVPKRIGWLLLAWGVPFAVVLPVSPVWGLPLIGALLVIGGGGAEPAEEAAR